MTRVIRINTGREGYAEVLRLVLDRARPRRPRGLPTRDAGVVTVEIADPTDMLATGTGRGLDPAIAAAEAAQLIGGYSNPEMMIKISERFRDFLDEDTGRFHGAYGVRIGGQLGQAVRKIERDRDTRQAIINLWDPWLDNQPGKRDIPCTVALRLSLWDDRLDLDVLMRSNDAYLGFPYDIFQFGQLQLTAARLLDVEAGTYRHTAWSLHVYERDLEAAGRVHNPPPEASLHRPLGIGRPGLDGYASTQARARALQTKLPDEPTESERWYRRALATRLG